MDISNIPLDDIVDDGYGKWFCICKHCAKNFDLNIPTLEHVANDEVCDVHKCCNEADYYVDVER